MNDETAPPQREHACKLLAELPLPAPALPEGAIPTKAIVVFRYTSPADAAGYGTAIAHTDNIDGALLLGMMRIADDRFRQLVATTWKDVQ